MRNPALATAIASILVSVVAALAAYASQKASAKANMSTSRLDMEREAYERARGYDTETIKRQDVELDELRAKLRSQSEELQDLRDQNRDLRNRVFLLEREQGLYRIDYEEQRDGKQRPPRGVQPEARRREPPVEPDDRGPDAG